MHEETFNELVSQALAQAESRRAVAHTPEEARDLSIAITHLEDALTRYNSSRYRHRGTWKRVDPDMLDPNGSFDNVHEGA